MAGHAIKRVFAEIQAPKSWAGGQWQFAGIAPVRFNDESKALVLVSEQLDDGEVSAIVCADNEPIIEFIEAHTDFWATGEQVVDVQGFDDDNEGEAQGFHPYAPSAEPSADESDDDSDESSDEDE